VSLKETLSPSLEIPLTSEEFNPLVKALGPFEPNPRIAVAVSGGKDSLALTLLLKEWADKNGGHLIALTIDHQLRLESTEEAHQVQAWLNRREIEHHILTWEGPKPSSHVQEEARNARYALLEKWCRDQGILHLFIAHHAGDQVETFFLRLEGGSGLDGLCGMAPIVETPYVRILRPLLKIPPMRLQAFLKREQQEWIEDPSNMRGCYRRNQIRHTLASELNGKIGTMILATTEKLARSRLALETHTARRLAHCSQIFLSGHVIVFLEELRQEPEEFQLRLLSHLLMVVSGHTYPPRSRYLETLYVALNSAAPFKARTCWGCVLRPHKGNVLIAREYSAIEEALPILKKDNFYWDQRFWITRRSQEKLRKVEENPLIIAKLGQEGWKHIAKFINAKYDSSVISHVFPTLPALWLDAALIAVPHLHYYGKHSKWTKEVAEIAFLPKKMSYKPFFTIR
jgi:tRNA(Ile)-lysidine synthase